MLRSSNSIHVPRVINKHGLFPTRNTSSCIRVTPIGHLRCSGMLHSVDWYLVTQVSEQLNGTIFKSQTPKLGPIGCPETSVNY
jgi:hypothetical protein